MFASEWRLGSATAEDALRLRREVFVKELGLEENLAFDKWDEYAAHLIIREENEPMAAARLYAVEEGVRMDMVCVRREYRKKRYGDLCIRLLMDKAVQMCAPQLYTNVPVSHIGYFVAFGFQACAGEKGGMQPMAVKPAQIIWHSACKQ